MRKIFTGLALAVILVMLSACDSVSAPSSIAKDQTATNTQLDRYQKNQPIPQSDFSQYRQTVIDVELAQIHGVATTSFFFNLGTTNPYKVCPSIGFPVPSTSQLTNPDQLITNNNNSNGGSYLQSGVVAQQEPNGAYTGASTGTYAVCVAPNGTKYISYAEAFVHTEGGPAHWDKAQGLIVLDGAPTVVSKSK